MKILTRLCATVLGIGYCPIAPGTVASGIAILIWWFLPLSHLLFYLIFIFISFLIGVWAATHTEQDFIHNIGVDKGRDPRIVVIDEAVGVLIAVFAIPKSLNIVIAAFLLFRFFDIIKPFPINRSQKIFGGWGIMIDDVIAGIFSNILVQLFRLILF